MDTEKVEQLLAAAGKKNRAEVLGKLKNAQSDAELLEIAKQYGASTDAEEPAWLADSYDLTDEELAMVSGGAQLPWDNEVDDNCCH